MTFYGRTACSGAWTTDTHTLSDFGTLQNSGEGGNLLFARENAGDYFRGVLDEVRYSSGALSQGELLCSPEPASASLALLAAGVGALVARRRKKKTAQGTSSEC